MSKEPNLYRDTLEYIFDKLPMYSRVGSVAYKKDLINIRDLCAYLHHPQNSFPSIHIGGTNGKGSTSNYLASIFVEMGLKVGIYTSPHLVDFRERIKIGSNYIPQQFVMDFVSKTKPFIESHKPSFFEISVAMAFDYFSQQKVDIAIIEVGLGGRLDSTNIIQPVMSIITNISLDHTQMLGTTIPEIATEKAGIIKENTPLIVSEFHSDYYTILDKKAAELQAPIYCAEELVIKTKHSLIYKNYSISIPQHLPPYQLKNLKGVFLAYILYATHYQIPIDTNIVELGIKHITKNTQFMGRWMELNLSKRVLVECAHNEAGIHTLIESLKHEKYATLHLIFGVVQDKDIRNIIPLLPQINTVYYITQANIPRAMDSNILTDLFVAQGYKDIQTIPNPKKALEQALEDASKDDLIVVTGSIFLVGDILSYYTF